MTYPSAPEMQKIQQTPQDIEKQLLEYTVKYYGHYREGYESYIHEFLMENFQLVCLYDRLLFERQKNATRIIRQTINIPKMQSEIFARLAQEAKILIGAKPIWTVNAPRNANPEVTQKCKNVEDLVNDVMTYDNWFWTWFSVKFWASIAPFSFIETSYVEEESWLPTGKTGGNERLNFERKPSYTGVRSKARFPWEIFYDFAYPSVEPPIFVRYLMSDEEVKEKIGSEEWTIPEGKQRLAYSKSGASRNYGLEIIRSVPRRLGGGGSEEKRFAKDQHEVLMCLGYFTDPLTKKRELKKWWVLNMQCVVKGPETVTKRRTAIPLIVCCTRRIPGFSFGLPPGDSAKQINRAINQTFNGRLEVVNYGLVPPFFQGEDAQFTEDKPVVAAATGIRVAGSVNEIKLITTSLNPSDVDSIIGYLEEQSRLITDTSEGSLGQFKAGTPPSAMESSLSAQGQATKLGLFMLTEEPFFKEWARQVYWTMMEEAPAKVEVGGRAYDLIQCIIGEPDFDLPQLGEAAGRTADQLQIQAFFSQLAPIFQVPGISKQSHPALFALIEKYALSLKQTWITEVTEPEAHQMKVEPAGISNETEAALQMQEQQDAATAAAAAKNQNGNLNPKGAKANVG